MIGIELNSESEIACSMCAKSVLSASLGSFIFFNKSELGSHFSSLSVLLCLIQIEIIGGGGGGGLDLQIWDLNRAHETEGTVFPIPQVFSMCGRRL